MRSVADIVRKRPRRRQSGRHAPRYVAANPAFQRMTGYSEAELRGLTPLDITHEDDLDASEAIIAAQVAGEPYLQHARSATDARMAK